VVADAGLRWGRRGRGSARRSVPESLTCSFGCDWSHYMLLAAPLAGASTRVYPRRGADTE
jgi:hypothetical protein